MTAEIWNCTDTEYHAATDRYGHTQIEVVRKSPGRFRGLYIDESIALPRRVLSSQDSLDFGNALHCAILQPSKFKGRYLVGPCDDRRSSDWKAWAKGVREHTGDDHAPFILLQASKGSLIDAMAARCYKHSELGKLLGNSSAGREVAVRWECDVTGLPLKCRFDLHEDEHEVHTVLDLKSCEESDTDHAAKASANYGYHRQQALYSMGHRAMWGAYPDRYLLGFVSKVPPHDVGLITLDDDSADLGFEERLADLENIARRIESDDWRAPQSVGIQTVRLPRHAFPPEDAGPPITMGGKDL